MTERNAHDFDYDPQTRHYRTFDMNVRDEQRERVISKLAEHLLATGLGAASLRQLAAAADVSDRMLLYYFSDKTEVLAMTMARVAARLAEHLAAALPEGQTLSPGVLARTAASISTTDEVRPFMRLWIEVVAASARREPPFVAIAEQITAGFLQWIESRLDPELAADRKASAALILALIDGIALVDICAGQESSRHAVEALSRQTSVIISEI